MLIAAVDVTPAVMNTPHIGLSSTKYTVDVTVIVVLPTVTVLIIALMLTIIVRGRPWLRSEQSKRLVWLTWRTRI